MQMPGCYHIQHYNYRYRRTGILWEGWYKAILIDNESYLLTYMPYINGLVALE